MPPTAWVAWIAGAIVAAGVAWAAVWGLLRWATAQVIERESRTARADLKAFLDTLETPAGGPSWVDDVTLCIKTFHRPRCIVRAVRSFKSRYPALRVMVADDSCRPLLPDGWSRAGISWHRLPYDTGISVGRNALLDRVETPWIVNCDDDFFAIDTTDLEQLYAALLERGLDLVGGGSGRAHAARFRREGDRLWIEVGHPPRELAPGLFATDRASNFFMARTERVRKLRWNEDLKLLEHTEFFYRAWKEGWRVAEMPGVLAGHEEASCLPRERLVAWLAYGRFRARVRRWSRAFRRLTGRPYLAAFDADGLRRVKTVRVA
jgi:hypothetical protein